MPRFKHLHVRSLRPCRRGPGAGHPVRAPSWRVHSGLLRRWLPMLGLLVAANAATAIAEQDVVSRVITSIDAGAFGDADAMIARALKEESVVSSQRAALEFERERMRRMRLDFTLTAEDARARIRKQNSGSQGLRVRGVGCTGPARGVEHRRRAPVLQPCPFQSLSPECRGARASYQSRAVQRRHRSSGTPAPPRSDRRAPRERTRERCAAARPRHAFDHRAGRCPPGRRDLTRVDSISALACRAARKHPTALERTCESHGRAGKRTATHCVSRRSGAGRAADALYRHV